MLAGAHQELPLVPPPSTSITISGGLDPYTGPWGHDQAAHLLRRTTFGLKKSDLDLFLSMSMEEAVDHLLNYDQTPPDPPINNYNALDPDDLLIDPNVDPGEDWTEAEFDEDFEGFRIESFRGWWTRLMVNQEATIREKLTLFWHNHFATQTEAIFYGKTNYKHNVMLRRNALGNFKEFVKEVTLDPLMLVYLNGFLNHKDAPDENYARELQELFTIGKDEPNHYTEDDVYQAARVLTGWRINFFPSEYYFEPADHDTGNKQFSSYYNNTVIQGSNNGEAELDDLLDMIFEKGEVAKYICRKLYRWFVYYKIDDTVEQDVIEPLAEMFRNGGYEIKPIMEVLLKSEHFFDAVNSGCFIKTPVDIVVGTFRNFNLSTDASNLYDDFLFPYYLNVLMADQQMIPGDPPNVAGWQAFRQFPQYYRMWINSDTARNRNFYTDVMSVIGIEGDQDTIMIDHIEYASQFDEPEDPNKLIDNLVALLLPQPISLAKKTLLKSILLSGLPNDSYWTNAWFDYQNNPTDPMAFEVVNVRLTILHKYIMNLAEYQLA